MQNPTDHRWQCRIAPSLGALEDTPDNIWGTKPYLDEFQDSVFFGIYGLPDFYTLWRHKGRKAILWAGSDIKHFINGYWLDAEGKNRIDPEPLARWINENCDSYVENGVEHEALETLGIQSKIVPSFLGDVTKYQNVYRNNDRPQVYLSVSGDNFAMYGWELVELIADQCDVDFHLYGNINPWVSKHSNVFVHGRVSKEQMNDEVKTMSGALRTLEFDGFSEIIAKSILWGQRPISAIAYPGASVYATPTELVTLLNDPKTFSGAPTSNREYLIRILNKYPWTYAR